jgi:hypothetical protein
MIVKDGVTRLGRGGHESPGSEDEALRRNLATAVAAWGRLGPSIRDIE